jgi:hypothetical protein
MVERYEVGRPYTRRRRVKVALADLDGMRAVMEAMAASDFSVEGRLADLEAQAAEMPRSAHEKQRESLGWYAGRILDTIAMLRRQMERGEIGLAVDLALDLGVLATEAKMIQYMTSNPAQGGKTKAWQDRRAVDERIAIYRQQAEEKWRRNPALKASEVARYIKGPKEGPRLAPNYIRKKIADLDPKKR